MTRYTNGNNYNPDFGIIPGYDAIYGLKSKKQAYKDWQKHVGSKGRSIRYTHHRPDFGSTRQAYQEIKHSLSDAVDDVLPFIK